MCRIYKKDIINLFTKQKETHRYRKQIHGYQRGWGEFPGSSVGKESACSAEDPGLTPGLGRSPGEGNGNTLQYPCLENPVDRKSWWATIHGVARVGHDLATKPLARGWAGV